MAYKYSFMIRNEISQNGRVFGLCPAAAFHGMERAFHMVEYSGGGAARIVPDG
jgi:hypothetical protein